jgi:hypothetical protein
MQHLQVENQRPARPVRQYDVPTSRYVRMTEQLQPQGGKEFRRRLGGRRPPRTSRRARSAAVQGAGIRRAVQQGTKKRRPYACVLGRGPQRRPTCQRLTANMSFAPRRGCIIVESLALVRYHLSPSAISHSFFLYYVYIWFHCNGTIMRFFFSPKKTTYYFVIWEADNFRHHSSWHDWLLNGCHVPFEWLPGSLIDYWWDIIFSVFSAVLSSVCWWAASRALCDKISMWLPLSLHNCLM